MTAARQVTPHPKPAPRQRAGRPLLPAAEGLAAWRRRSRDRAVARARAAVVEPPAPRAVLGRSPTRRQPRAHEVPAPVRSAVRARSGGRCEAALPGCNRMAVLMHHRKLRSQGGEHTVENLLHLCVHCHEHIHAHPAASRALGQIVGRSA